MFIVSADFLDFVLNPGMKQLRAYLKGTKDFLLWLEDFKVQYPQLPPLFAFLTVDYCSMYPSMPDNLILPAVQEFLDARGEKNPTTAKTMELGVPVLVKSMTHPSAAWGLAN